MLQAHNDEDRSPRTTAKMSPKSPPGGADFEGAYLLTHSVLSHISHVRSLVILPSYNSIQSIELNLQAGSRERGFAAQNASISAS